MHFHFAALMGASPKELTVGRNPGPRPARRPPARPTPTRTGRRPGRAEPENVGVELSQAGADRINEAFPTKPQGDGQVVVAVVDAQPGQGGIGGHLFTESCAANRAARRAACSTGSGTNPAVYQNLRKSRPEAEANVCSSQLSWLVQRPPPTRWYRKAASTARLMPDFGPQRGCRPPSGPSDHPFAAANVMFITS
jgi:hypothetical protein